MLVFITRPFKRPRGGYGLSKTCPVHDIFSLVESSYMNWIIVVVVDILKKHQLL